jgi:hypothetical protein
VPIVLFFVFVAVVCVCILALGHGLSSSGEQPVGRRCRTSHVIHRRRRVRKQRVQCRLEN